VLETRPERGRQGGGCRRRGHSASGRPRLREVGPGAQQRHRRAAGRLVPGSELSRRGNALTGTYAMWLCQHPDVQDFGCWLLVNAGLARCRRPLGRPARSRAAALRRQARQPGAALAPACRAPVAGERHHRELHDPTHRTAPVRRRRAISVDFPRQQGTRVPRHSRTELGLIYARCSPPPADQAMPMSQLGTGMIPDTASLTDQHAACVPVHRYPRCPQRRVLGLDTGLTRPARWPVSSARSLRTWPARLREVGLGCAAAPPMCRRPARPGHRAGSGGTALARVHRWPGMSYVAGTVSAWERC
jgi:hypothetical protein